MRMFKMGRKCYADSKDVWHEYINIDCISTIEGHVVKDKWSTHVRKGYNVFMNNGNKIWIDDIEMASLSKLINN